MRKGPPVTPENKQLAHYAVAAVGGSLRVNEYEHESEPLYIDLFWIEGRPQPDATTYGTIGLSDTPMEWEEGIYPTRLEFVGACRTEEKSFGNIIAAAAFSVMRSRAFHGPGDVMPGFVAEYVEKTSVPHLYLTSPYLWQEKLKVAVFGKKEVAWLLAMPISEKEYQFLLKNGDEALEARLEKKNVDICDLYRRSAV